MPESPKYVGMGLERASRGLSVLIPPTTQSTPVSAVFLAQFNVHSGYELVWSRAVDGVNLEGIEYKALPSGLHSTKQDVISFVQPASDSKQLDDVLYGVAVFQQHGGDSGDRSTVKMFSLGVLIDPKRHRVLPSANPVWRPTNFASGVEHVEQLRKLLEHWDESDGFAGFDSIFEQKSDVMNFVSSPSSSPRAQRILSDHKVGHHHYLHHLDTLLETLGPLVFRLWRSSLLREKIVLFDAPSVELNCAFAYCLSILSTVPQELQSLLTDDATRDLLCNRPVYSVGVNDSDWLKTLKEEHGFIAASSDEILAYKSQLYDTGVKFSNGDDDIPKVFPSTSKVPGATSSEYKATQRDLKRFEVLVREYELYKDTDGSQLQWWNAVVEPVSWRHMAWSGLYWWASAGEKEKMDDEGYAEDIAEYSEFSSTERLLSIVGYFQGLTRRVLRSVSDLVGADAEGPVIVEFADFIEMGLDPYSKGDVEFVIKLVEVWWCREAKVGGLSLCCF